MRDDFRLRNREYPDPIHFGHGNQFAIGTPGDLRVGSTAIVKYLATDRFVFTDIEQPQRRLNLIDPTRSVLFSTCR
jgi:hypothetical protein